MHIKFYKGSCCIGMIAFVLYVERTKVDNNNEIKMSQRQ